jgi:hypothetical protein
MNFHIGQSVYIGYCPARQMGTSIDPRCSTGTILGGPFVDRKCAHGYVKGVSWRVAPDVGGVVIAAQNMLFPFSDPDEAEARETDREVAA